MRKIQTKRLKTTAVFLASLILLQGCVVYHKTPSTLEQARQENIKTKIMTTDNETSKYKYITYEEGTFYGVNKKSGELVKTPLIQEEVTEVLTKNEKASTLWTVIAIGVPVVFLAVGFAIAESGLGTAGWGY